MAQQFGTSWHQVEFNLKSTPSLSNFTMVLNVVCMWMVETGFTLTEMSDRSGALTQDRLTLMVRLDGFLLRALSHLEQVYWFKQHYHGKMSADPTSSYFPTYRNAEIVSTLPRKHLDWQDWWTRFAVCSGCTRTKEKQEPYSPWEMSIQSTGFSNLGDILAG